MGSIPMAFWLILIALFVLAGRRRRRWERWTRMDPRCLSPGHGRGYQRASERDRSEAESYIELLANRVERLEERLDFTEKLLMGRSAKSD